MDCRSDHLVVLTANVDIGLERLTLIVAACPKGRYGINCHFECECEGSTCNPETGDCVCKAGKHGVVCDQGNTPLAKLTYINNMTETSRNGK